MKLRNHAFLSVCCPLYQLLRGGGRSHTLRSGGLDPLPDLGELGAAFLAAGSLLLILKMLN